MTINQNILFANTPYDGPERTDNPVYPVFASIYKGMQKRNWIPENIDMSQDKPKFERLPQTVQEVFTQNLAWQVYADSDQSENLLSIALYTNNTECRRCITLQAAEESNHSGSYQYVISSMYDDPTAMLDRMEQDIDIQKRRILSSKLGSKPIETNHFHTAIKMLALEGISFTASFLITLAVHHNFEGGLPGCKDQILKIAADESGHLVLWSQIVKILITQKLIEPGDIIRILTHTVGNELKWIKHIYSIHPLPETEPNRVHKLLMLKANQVARGVGLENIYPQTGSTSSLFNWYNRTININSTQVAPQADEGLTYIAGKVKDDWS